MLFGAILLLLAGLFVFDEYTPMNFADHALYGTVVLLAMLSRFAWMPSLAAAAGTILTVIGGMGTPWFPDLPRWIPIGNRIITIAILWILVWFAWKHRQDETALQNANEDLEQKVLERTRELVVANQALVSKVAEHLQSKRALRLSEGRLASILDTAEDAVVVMELNRSIVLFNQGASRLFGYAPGEVLGHSIDRLFPERVRDEQVRHIDSFAGMSEFTHRTVQPKEVYGLRKDGTEFPAEAGISKLAIEDKLIVTVILRDITSRQRTQRQLQSLTAELLTAQEEERRRIARDLHDDINQRLALLAMEVESFVSVPETANTKTRELVQSLAHRLAVLSDDVRRMAYRFHPSVLDDLGLSAALKHLTDQWSAKTGIRMVVVQEETADSLPRHIASCLYWIAQETLANIMKHAQADRVEIELIYDQGDQEVTLSIHDNGVGFDLEQIQDRHFGLGLVNMRERARSVKGRFDIHSEQNLGTHITVNIPLSGAPYEETTSSRR